MTYGTITTPAEGTALPVDTIAGTKFPRTKIAIGAEGVATDVSATNPLPVTMTGGGDATAANQATGNAALASILAKIIASPATEATLASILAKISADPATQTTLAAVLAKLSADPATQTTLAAVLTKLNASVAVTGPLTDAQLRAAAVPTSLTATENYVGKTGGDVLPASATPTVSTTAYASGDVIGVKMTLASMTRVAAGAGLVQTVTLNCKSAQTGAVDLLLFSADPSASTFTDNATLAVAAADYDKLIGVVHLTDWTNLGTPSMAQAQNVGMGFKLPSGTTLYGVLVARSTPTLASTSDIKLSVQVIPG